MATSPSPLTQLQVPQKSTLLRRPRTAPAPGAAPPNQQGGGFQNIADEFGFTLNKNQLTGNPFLSVQGGEGVGNFSFATLPGETPEAFRQRLTQNRIFTNFQDQGILRGGTPPGVTQLPPPVPQPQLPPNAPTTAPPFINSQGQTITPNGVNVAPGSFDPFINSQGQTIGGLPQPTRSRGGGSFKSIICNPGFHQEGDSCVPDGSAPALQPATGQGTIGTPLTQAQSIANISSGIGPSAPTPIPQPRTTGLVNRPIANQPPTGTGAGGAAGFSGDFTDLLSQFGGGGGFPGAGQTGSSKLTPEVLETFRRVAELEGFPSGGGAGAGGVPGAGGAGGLLDLLRQRFGGGGGLPPPGAAPAPAGTQQTPAGPFDQFNNPNFPQGPGVSGGIGQDFGFDRQQIVNMLNSVPGLVDSLQDSPLPGIRNLNLQALGQGLQNDLLPRASTSLADRLGRGPEAGFQDLPFSDQLSDIISQFGGQLGGPIQGQGEIGQLLSRLSGGDLPRSFQGQLEGLVGQLGQSGTNPFGPGLTGEEAAAQRSILDTTLERARGRAVTDIKADAARRGLTSRDAPSQERLARLDEELARQAGTLANQQLLQDFDLRRSSGQLGLSRQQTLADIIGGTRAEDLGLADLLGRVGLGASGQDKQFQLESLEGLGGLIGPERGLQAGQQSNLIDQITRLITSQQQLGLGQQQTLTSADLQQQAIDRLSQGDLGAFLNQLFSGGGGDGNTSGGGGDEGGGGFLDFLKRFVPNINFGGNTGPRIDNLTLPGADFNPRDLFNDPFTPQFIPQSPFDLNTNTGRGFDEFQFDTLNPRSSGFFGPGSAIFRSGIF